METNDFGITDEEIRAMRDDGDSRHRDRCDVALGVLFLPWLSRDAARRSLAAWNARASKEGR